MGRFFVKKMPAHTISDLVDIFLASVPKEKRKIINIGIRPGEKINEELIGRYESPRTVELDGYYVVLPQIEIPEVTNKYKNFKRLNDFEYSSNSTKILSRNELRKILISEGFI